MDLAGICSSLCASGFLCHFLCQLSSRFLTQHIPSLYIITLVRVVCVNDLTGPFATDGCEIRDD
jgi:hypothetical protein